MCDCNDNRPAFSETTKPRARKSYTCCECGSVIAAGERYESCRGKWESWTDSTGKRHGGIQTMRTCLPCVELRDEIAGLSDDGCFCFGELADEAAEIAYEMSEGWIDPFAGVDEFLERLEASRKEMPCGSCN